MKTHEIAVLPWDRKLVEQVQGDTDNAQRVDSILKHERTGKGVDWIAEMQQKSMGYRSSAKKRVKNFVIMCLHAGVPGGFFHTES